MGKYLMNFSLKTTLNEYLKYHWKRTENARKTLGFGELDISFWQLIWTKNYYQERCELLEKKVKLEKILKYKI